MDHHTWIKLYQKLLNFKDKGYNVYFTYNKCQLSRTSLIEHGNRGMYAGLLGTWHVDYASKNCLSIMIPSVDANTFLPKKSCRVLTHADFISLEEAIDCFTISKYETIKLTPENVLGSADAHNI